ncbi:MAG TPA: PTS sugar transporter subunit IIC [Candidatus Mediterraneibacter norfolkensis]|nr:PTS sugar transporter subunit IIC [Candidatus Mediterraneibacter norfolkensis]
MSIGLALTFGILYWLATNKLWYGALHLTRQPLVLAVPIGIIMGDVPTAMIIGAALQMIYLGAIAPGGTLPSDEALAACITIPLALQAGLAPEIAVTLAVPIGLLGVLIDNIKRTYHSYFIHMADKAVEENNIKKMRRAEFWYPLIASIPLRVVPAFLALLFGVDAVTAFLNAIPAWATNGLSVAGGLLPALGFAVTIMVIGKKRLLPYFIIGFAIVAYSGINTIGVAVFAVCIAILQGNFMQADEEKSALSFGDEDEEGGF